MSVTRGVAGSRWRQQAVWRASRGVAFVVGEGLALHEGHFRWGFHRVPFFRSPPLCSAVSQGGPFHFPPGLPGNGPVAGALRHWLFAESEGHCPQKGVWFEEGEISAWDLLRGTGSDQHTSTTITAANALAANTTYRRIQQEAAPNLPMALAREGPHLLPAPTPTPKPPARTHPGN